MMDSRKIKQDFPQLQQAIVYIDNAATTQKPQVVLDALINFYTKTNANIHRGLYALAEQATQLYEDARAQVAQFIGARPEELIFTRGTTESINFVATAWGNDHLQKGDEILISVMEHHSNSIPWQQIAKRKEAVLKVIPLNPDGTLDMAKVPDLLSKKTKIIALSHVSNALGTHNDMHAVRDFARQVGALFLIDAAQSVAHQEINVKELDCDFLAFSGHKMLGPTGIGGLYIKKELHDLISPYQFGGGMVFQASSQDATWLKAPHKFEAGTPPIAQAIGLGAAVKYIKSAIDFDALQRHEAALCTRLIEGLLELKQVTIVGPIEQLKAKGHLVSFTVDGYHAHDVAAYLGQQGICVRAGNHCAQPLARFLKIDATVRVSFYAYNTMDDVDMLVAAMRKFLK
ncbi:MAG: cysteine desulfurase [Candidatus Dependentiae bacterium]|nr:cysteine desulfurase [Candidatus Dependentiae bacterium]